MYSGGMECLIDCFRVTFVIAVIQFTAGYKRPAMMTELLTVETQKSAECFYTPNHSNVASDKGKKKEIYNNYASCLAPARPWSAPTALRAVEQMCCSYRLNRTLSQRHRGPMLQPWMAASSGLSHLPRLSQSCLRLLGGTKMLFEVNEASAYFFTSTTGSLCTANVKAARSASKNKTGTLCPPSSSPPTVFYSCHRNGYNLHHELIHIHTNVF